MTQPALDFFIRRGLALKIETTENTDAVPSTTTNGILLMNGVAATQFTKKERVIDRLFFTNNTFVVANKNAYIEGEFEVFCPATPGQATTQYPVADPLLQCAGMTSVLNAGGKTTIYNPITNSIPSSTAYFWHTDTYYKITGARHDISSLKMEIGMIFTGKVKVQGNYTTITKNSLPNVTTYNNIPITCTYDISEAGITNPVGGSELLVWAKQLELIFGNKLASKEYTTTKRSMISERKATFNFKMAKCDLNDFNPWTVRDAQTIVSFRMRTYESGNFGQRNGLYSQLYVRAQIDNIKEVDIDNDLGWELSGPVIASSAGGDDFLIQFGDDTITINTVFTGIVHGVAQNITETFTSTSRALVGTPVWSVSAGALPPGLSINAATGAVTGTVVAAGGPYSFTITVVDQQTPYPQTINQAYSGINVT